MRNILLGIMILFVFVSCKQATDAPVVDTKETTTIQTASLGSAFSIANEQVYQTDGTKFTQSFQINAYVHDISIATGNISNGVLTISIPTPPEATLISQLNNDSTKFVFSPNDVKTGDCELRFISNGSTYILRKGDYSSTYNIFLNEVGFFYTNKECTETGTYKTTTTLQSGLPLNSTYEAKVHSLTGWNKCNLIIDFKINTTNAVSSVLMTTESNSSINKWYLTKK